MHIEKNTNGNIVFYQSQRMNVCWGFIDSNNDYLSDRDDAKSQIFHLYKNAIALQLVLLEWLESHKCKDIRIRIKNYEKEDFWAICPVKDFRTLALKEFPNNAIFNYDTKTHATYGKQIRLPMHCFTRKYDGQETL